MGQFMKGFHKDPENITKCSFKDSARIWSRNSWKLDCHGSELGVVLHFVYCIKIFASRWWNATDFLFTVDPGQVLLMPLRGHLLLLCLKPCGGGSGIVKPSGCRKFAFEREAQNTEKFIKWVSRWGSYFNRASKYHLCPEGSSSGCLQVTS